MYCSKGKTKFKILSGSGKIQDNFFYGSIVRSIIKLYTYILWLHDTMMLYSEGVYMLDILFDQLI